MMPLAHFLLLTALTTTATPPVTFHPGRLRVSPEEKQRLLKELEENHSGTPGLPASINLSPGPTPEERVQLTQDEWSRRRQARAYEESIRRAQEDVDLLREKAAAVRANIGGPLFLQYKTGQF